MRSRRASLADCEGDVNARQVVHSARACFVHLRRQGQGHVPGGGGQQFPLPSGQTTQSTGEAGLGDASNTNATAMSVMMRNRLGVGAGSHVYSSAVGMPMGGARARAISPLPLSRATTVHSKWLLRLRRSSLSCGHFNRAHTNRA